MAQTFAIYKYPPCLLARLYKRFISIISLFPDRFQYFFSLTWKLDGDSKSNNVVYLKWLSVNHKSPISLL